MNAYNLYSIWACSICAASHQSKQRALVHTKKHHLDSQGARVVLDRNATITSIDTPTPNVETDSHKDECANVETVNLKQIDYFFCVVKSYTFIYMRHE